jgi:hypothetical protein
LLSLYFSVGLGRALSDFSSSSLHSDIILSRDSKKESHFSRPLYLKLIRRLFHEIQHLVFIL